VALGGSRVADRAPFPIPTQSINGDNMTALKVKPYPGLQRIAPETIEKHELDVQLHDLRSEFLQHEGKLRQDYLDRVAQITSGE
jgi:hypothetical protein